MKRHSDKAPGAGVERHVVLVEPEIHWNTGNVGRTCLGAGASLHLIEPLGFSLGSREVKRAGLDYWPRVRLSVWENFEKFREAMTPRQEEVILLTKLGARSFRDMPLSERMFLIFGSETRGLPDAILSMYAQQTYHIPITGDIRSLNLSTSAAVALYESLRGVGPAHAWGAE
ncbi:MAG: tRNA (cytidine(34)-2'-O)-methyltransferase [Desulfobacterales bacterium]|nr:tRNA (cytidine(34)-2'-O)-methyltransferase [Desulfobacterales bacterium]